MVVKLVNNPWKFINRCLVCGAKMVFLASTQEDAMPHEGSKSCSYKHNQFSVVGTFDADDTFRVSYHLPVSK